MFSCDPAIVGGWCVPPGGSVRGVYGGRQVVGDGVNGAGQGQGIDFPMDRALGGVVEASNAARSLRR